MQIKIYITNLGAYNRGELRGKWISLPMDQDYLQAEIKHILDTPFNDEEIFITDYEAPFFIAEHENISDLNEFAEELAEVDETEDIIEVISKDVLGEGNSRNKLIRILKERDYEAISEVYTEQDLALKVDEKTLPFDYQAVDEAGAVNYIDWETVGRDMTFNGWNIVGNGLAVIVHK